MTAAPQEESIGPYKTIRKLGEGGMGVVYLAHDDQLDRAIAIKLLPQHLAGDDEQLARLRQEARTASSLNHPNIITIYEIQQAGSSHVIATEFVEGQFNDHIIEGVRKFHDKTRQDTSAQSQVTAAH